MKDVEVEIKGNVKISDDFYKLSFFWDKSFGEPVAGNFCEINVNDLTSPTLRRPFAFADFDGNECAEIIYQNRGTATNILADKNKYDKIKILAPLGNSFFDEFTKNKKRIFAVAGGVGLGPILFAAKTAPIPAILVAGFRTENLVPNSKVFAGTKTILCTDDGSAGFCGNVVEYLKTTDINSDDLIIACGPTPMLKALHDFAAEKNIVCKISMEEMMACGVGACMGCVCETKYGNKRVCKEGPVFDSGEIVF